MSLHSIGSSLVCLVCALLLSGCVHTKQNPFEVKLALEKKIEAMRTEFEEEAKRSEKAISDAKDSIIAAKDAQIVRATDGLYAADQAFRSILEPTRTDLIVNNYVNESWVSLGRLVPSYEQLQIITQRLHDELDENKTSMEALRKRHAATMAENQQLVDTTLAKVAELAALEKTKADLETTQAAALAAKQEELNAANNKRIAEEKARADDSTAIQKAKMKLSMAAGALAAVLLLGAIFSPFYKDKCAVAAAVFGVASVGVWYLTQEIVLGILAVGLLGIVVWTIWDKRKDAKALANEAAVNTDNIRAIQRIKEKAPDVYEATVKPELVEAHLKYVEDENGTVTKAPDPERIAFIDKRLAEVGDK